MKRLYRAVFISLVAVSALITGCKNDDDVKMAKESQMTGLAAPIALQPDTTIIVLKDYFLDPHKIDSVKPDGALRFSFSSDTSKLILVPVQKPLPAISLVTVWVKGFAYSLLVERSPKIWKRIVIFLSGPVG